MYGHFTDIAMIVSLLTLPLSGTNNNCTNYCWMAFDNRTGNESELVFRDLTGKTLTGIITVDGMVSPPVAKPPTDHYTSIKLEDRNGISEPLKLHIHYLKNGTQYMELDANANNLSHYSQILHEPFDNNKIRIQISDLKTRTRHYYSVYTKGVLVPCNFGNETIFKSLYQETSISATGTIKGFRSDNSIHQISYVSVCSKETPKICSKNPSKVHVEAGTSYTLHCWGSGAPYLSLKWSYDATLGNLSESGIEHDHDTSQDHIIKSSLTFTNFSSNHIGLYNCTITNTNFNVSDDVSFMVYEKTNVTITTNNTVDFYNYNDETITFGFNIKGLNPGEKVDLTCLAFNHTGDGSMDTEMEKVSEGYHKVEYVGKHIMENVTCTFRRNEDILFSKTFHRVGEGCVDGERGKGLRCTECGRLQTSAFPHVACFQARSNCYANYWGVEDNCTLCPFGTIAPNRTAVKEQDCQIVSSSCEAGTYGIGLACLKCPFGFSSRRSSVKLGECTDTSSTCEVNTYLESNGTCVECPYGYASEKGAGKRQDCTLRASECPPNTYGFDKASCKPCPEGKLSHSSSRYLSDCFDPPKPKKHSVALSVGVGTAVFVVILLVIGFTLRTIHKHRSVPRANIRVAFETGASRDTLVVENAPATTE